MNPEDDKRDRQLMELLNELRIALPGVQILFGFLLTVPFAQGFARVTPTQKALLYATLLSTCASTICLIAPSATHRLRFHKRDRAYVVEAANAYLLAGLALLGLALVLALALISDVLYNGVLAWLAPAVAGLTIVLLWFLRPVARGTRSSGP
jgi:hypothetical protein